MFDHVRPYIQSAPHPLIEHQMRNAASEFCRATRCWRHVETIALDGSEDEVEVESFQDYAQAFELEIAHFNGRELTKTSYSDIRPDHLTAEGAPRWITQKRLDAFIVAPRAAGSLRLSLFLEPSVAGQEFPEELGDKFGLYIAQGAGGRILLVPNQPYTNPQLATFFLSEFQKAKDKYSSVNITGQQRAPRRTKPSFC